MHWQIFKQCNINCCTKLPKLLWLLFFFLSSMSFSQFLLSWHSLFLMFQRLYKMKSRRRSYLPMKRYMPSLLQHHPLIDLLQFTRVMIFSINELLLTAHFVDSRADILLFIRTIYSISLSNDANCSLLYICMHISCVANIFKFNHFVLLHTCVEDGKVNINSWCYFAAIFI